MNPASQQGTAQAGGGSVMLWGVSSWHDMGPLICLETTLTGDSRTMRHPRIDTEWLQEHSSEFRHFCWPPKSPDMNIIEYIWDALQRAVQKRSPSPLIYTDLWTTLQDSWIFHQCLILTLTFGIVTISAKRWRNKQGRPKNPKHPREMHEQEQVKSATREECLDPVQSEDRMTIGNSAEDFRLIEKGLQILEMQTPTKSVFYQKDKE
ncbi:transposable element Tcb2 transposase [Trichonephila clavipes]|nr:transposable element Tcb2 transposase [Trichonephila clavipes]